MPPRAPDDLLPLTPVVLHILLALAAGERHGYAVAQEVEALTDGTVRMGPGTLYGSIQRMLAAGLIEETSGAGRGAARGDDDRARRYYRATALGRRVLQRELERLARVVDHARDRRLLPRPWAT
jgi:DNA-binding PadR family transcriptional regulator